MATASLPAYRRGGGRHSLALARGRGVWREAGGAAAKARCGKGLGWSWAMEGRVRVGRSGCCACLPACLPAYACLACLADRQA
ncbi:hypothetical protein PHLCEN_2v9657 [Hermanssonia centrifuga]|uniref:Uncharacterized protein n=1 Tax=Hermanssonia centrifuga TaxID=98765 RepID=A0A2R6NQ51_9APHY|nr:hypothetical protein PHLCEN_2v9657 [Hermanssonia centrifuga]